MKFVLNGLKMNCNLFRIETKGTSKYPLQLLQFHLNLERFSIEGHKTKAKGTNNTLKAIQVLASSEGKRVRKDTFGLVLHLIG